MKQFPRILQKVLEKTELIHKIKRKLEKCKKMSQRIENL